jgi:hypothetical protein
MEKPMTDNLPTAIEEGTLDIGGVTLRTYVLDDGRRIINAEDLSKLFVSLAGGTEIAEMEANAFAQALHRLKP